MISKAAYTKDHRFLSVLGSSLSFTFTIFFDFHIKIRQSCWCMQRWRDIVFLWVLFLRPQSSYKQYQLRQHCIWKRREAPNRVYKGQLQIRRWITVKKLTKMAWLDPKQLEVPKYIQSVPFINRLWSWLFFFEICILELCYRKKHGVLGNSDITCWRIWSVTLVMDMRGFLFLSSCLMIHSLRIFSIVILSISFH